jgi:cytochrome d ubiquinol oxidase subunit II
MLCNARGVRSEATVSLEVLCAGVLFAGLTAYALFGGADFGAGFWMAFAFGPRRVAQREAMFQAMSPVWETNHVWLILVLVTLWTTFPPVFSAVFTGLYLPLTVALLGIVFRGAAFAFRHYSSPEAGQLPATGLVFSVASIITPFAMGVAVGAVAGGHLDPKAGDTDIFEAWLRPFPLVCGLIGLAVSAFLTPAYMLLRPVGVLRADFRHSAIAGSLLLGATTAIAIPVAYWDATAFSHGLAEPRAVIFIAMAIALGLTSLAVFMKRLDRLAPVVAGATVVTVLGAWAAAQYPYVLLPDLHIEDAAAGDATLEAFLIALPVGSVILVPSLMWLFSLFAAERPEESSEI